MLTELLAQRDHWILIRGNGAGLGILEGDPEEDKIPVKLLPLTARANVVLLTEQTGGQR